MEAQQTRIGGRFIARDRGSEDSDEPITEIARFNWSRPTAPLIDFLNEDSLQQLRRFFAAREYKSHSIQV